MAPPIRLQLMTPTPLLNTWQRWHHRQQKRYMKQVAMEFFIQLRKLEKRPPLAKCHVVITRKSTGTPDWDGLYASAKAPLDCLVVPTKRNPHGLGVIQDDNPSCVLSLTVVPVKVKKSEQGTAIEIFEVCDAGEDGPDH